jgi:DNA-binding CsgD family transcriptional regulator
MQGSGNSNNKKKAQKTKRVSVRPRWTKEEVSLLRRLYRSHSNAEIAQILGRKVSSVVFKGHRLGLSKGARRLKEMGKENISRRWEPQKHRSSKKARA